MVTHMALWVRQQALHHDRDMWRQEVDRNTKVPCHVSENVQILEWCVGHCSLMCRDALYISIQRPANAIILGTHLSFSSRLYFERSSSSSWTKWWKPIYNLYTVPWVTTWIIVWSWDDHTSGSNSTLIKTHHSSSHVWNVRFYHGEDLDVENSNPACNT